MTAHYQNIATSMRPTPNDIGEYSLDTDIHGRMNFSNTEVFMK